jgi:hypothetical protein
VDYSDAVTPGDWPQENTITRTWTATDAWENSASEDISPPDAPIAFVATAEDNCDDEVPVEIIAFDCFEFTKKGKRIDKTESCVLEVAGDTLTILDTGGVGTYISWTGIAADDCGKATQVECQVEVVNPND